MAFSTKKVSSFWHISLQHRTVLIISPLILQIIITSEGEGVLCMLHSVQKQFKSYPYWNAVSHVTSRWLEDEQFTVTNTFKLSLRPEHYLIQSVTGLLTVVWQCQSWVVQSQTEISRMSPSQVFHVLQQSQISFQLSATTAIQTVCLNDTNLCCLWTQRVFATFVFSLGVERSLNTQV